MKQETAHEIKKDIPPLRFLQIDTIYSKYARSLYTQRPGLRDAPFAVQYEALLTDGYAAGHRIAPVLREFGVTTGHIVANGVSAQTQWLREQGRPRHLDEGNVLDVVVEQIDRFRPDVLYSTDTINLGTKLFRRLKRRPALTVGWHASDIPADADWSGFDLILSGFSKLRELAIGRLGSRAAEAYLPGFPVDVVERVGGGLPQEDVVFAGQYTLTQHRFRGRLLEAIAHSGAERGWSVAFHLMTGADPLPKSVQAFSGPPLFGLHMYRALCQGRIVFDGRSEANYHTPDGPVDLAGNETSNMRLFEATGCGRFLLTQRLDTVGHLFEPGVEIETFSDEEELIDKIVYYLRYPNQREAMAARAHQRFLKDHTMNVRARQYLKIINKYL